MTPAVSMGIALLVLSGAPPPSPTDANVRSTNPRIRAAIAEGSSTSPTFRSLVERLQGSTVIIYIERGDCTCVRARSCLAFVASTGGVRYLRAHVSLFQGQRKLIEQIGHELHHAWEMAEAPEVTSGRAFERFFARLAGKGCPERRCYETPGALAVEAAVRRELASSVAVLGRR
jgi:hypothetical protein